MSTLIVNMYEPPFLCQRKGCTGRFDRLVVVTGPTGEVLELLWLCQGHMAEYRDRLIDTMDTTPKVKH